MTYDYLTINFTSVVGFILLLTFLIGNASLDRSIKRTFYLLIFVEFVEMCTYSLELWTTTLPTLSPLRLWLSAIGYAVRPFIFCLILKLTMRNDLSPRTALLIWVPVALNVIASFSVFFTDAVYAYTPDNQFVRGPLGFFTHGVVVFYLLVLIVVVVRSYADRPKLEVLVIFAIFLLVLFSMVVEAVYLIRTLGRTTIIMVTIFYFMFFQSQLHNASLSEEKSIRSRLEQVSRLDGSTGVLNKPAFIREAGLLLAPAEDVKHTSLVFLFLDMDHLKALNDTLGHAMGDAAIAEVARTLRSLCRTTDLVGRFGGDEFCVLLPDMPRQRFYTFLQEVQNGLRRTYTGEGRSVATSVSIGAVYAENLRGLSYEKLVELADGALYEAKAAGRDCHVVREW